MLTRCKIIIGTSRYINVLDLDMLPKITVAGVEIKYSTHVKYLGVWIANNLSWDRQITNTTCKARSILHQLKLCKHLIPETIKAKLVISLIYPHIDYCCAVLTDLTSLSDLKLYRAVNACIRFIFNLRRDIHITPYYTRLRWLKPNKRRDYFVACQLYNILSTQQPNLLFKSFVIRVQTSLTNTRTNNSPLVPLCRILDRDF